jgi:hypothetical protein
LFDLPSLCLCLFFSNRSSGSPLQLCIYRGCVGVSLRLGYLRLIVIFPGALIFIRIGLETPCFSWMGTPTILPLSNCWKWFSSCVNGLFLQRGTQTQTEQLVVEVVCTVLCLVVFCTVAWSQGASSVSRGKKMKNGNDKRRRFWLEVASLHLVLRVSTFFNRAPGQNFGAFYKMVLGL